MGAHRKQFPMKLHLDGIQWNREKKIHFLQRLVYIFLVDEILLKGIFHNRACRTSIMCKMTIN